jgi:hypothetical protein
LFGKPIRVDRKGNADLEPIRVPYPFLSVIGGIPPEMLTELRERSGRHDGFIERLLIAIPDPRPRPRWSDEGIPEETTAEWAEIVGRLRARALATSTDGREHPHTVLFSSSAKAAWVLWYDSHVDETNDPGYDAGDLAADGKLADFAGRLVLILHLLNLACDPTRGAGDPMPEVNARSVQDAIALWAYFRAHARRARWIISGGIGNADARAILEWVKRRGAVEFTEREVAKDLSRFASDREALATALDWLEDRHVIRPAPKPNRPASSRGRKPSPGWVVHPSISASGCG